MISIKKKWRELPKEERLNIPEKEFKISSSKIENIRKIKDPKTRLIEAARIQYEKFRQINSYITTWIAGYGSDVVIRQKFGSTKNLYKIFFKDIEHHSEVHLSWPDIKRRVRIPKEITGDLAEEVGIHIGDGNLQNAPRKDGIKYYVYTITGDLKDEEIYHKKHLKELLHKIYGIKPTIIERPSKNSIETRIKSRAVTEFKKNILKLDSGNKKKIKIPGEIMKNKELSKRCAAGIIDTDFSITSSIAITGKLASFTILDQLAEIFTKNKIKFKLTKYKGYGRFYINKKGAIEIINKWKLNNIKHLSKYECYIKFRNTFPNSKTTERIALIKGKIGHQDLLEICNKRRKYAPGRT